VLRATYRGPVEKLDGKRAFIRFVSHDDVVARFDEIKLDPEWPRFPASDFVIDEAREPDRGATLLANVLVFILLFLFLAIMSQW